MAAIRIVYTPPVDRDISEAFSFFADLQERGLAADPERFAQGLFALVAEEAARQAALPISRPAISRDERMRLAARGQNRAGVMRLLYATSGKSPWYIYFTLDDTDDDGEIDTMNVLYLRHASRR